jgi:ATP-binding cassette, subfamily B, bacterial
VSRLDIMRLAKGAGPLLVTADLVVNLIAGALPVVCTIAAAVVVGRVPAAARGGLHSSASKMRECNG